MLYKWFLFFTEPKTFRMRTERFFCTEKVFKKLNGNLWKDNKKWQARNERAYADDIIRFARVIEFFFIAFVLLFLVNASNHDNTNSDDFQSDLLSMSYGEYC